MRRHAGDARAAEAQRPVLHQLVGTETGGVSLQPCRRPRMSRTNLDTLINGERHQILIEPYWTLLHVLRNVVGMMGTKENCRRLHHSGQHLRPD
jgi:hypothetical protein